MHIENLAQNKEAWLTQIKQKQQMIQDQKEYEKNAPVGSPLNYLQKSQNDSTSIASSQISKIGALIENLQQPYSNVLYPFPIEDQKRVSFQ